MVDKTKKILVVDDLPDWQKTLRGLLQDGGYDVDIAIADPHNVSRQEILRLAYDLQRSFHYDFPSNTAPYMALHLRPGSLDEWCAFGVGIGYEAAPKFLPQQAPSSLESWVRALVQSDYYADRSGERVGLMAYANDPASKPNCDKFPEWK